MIFLNIKKIILSFILTFAIGNAPLLFVETSTKLLSTPKLTPPNWVFPIAWTIIYTLMAISLYIIWNKCNKIPKIYLVQLIVNALWTIVFFGFQLRLLAFLIIILLIVLVSSMIIMFFLINKKAGYLNLPYLFWIIFAAYLNLGIYLLNR